MNKYRLPQDIYDRKHDREVSRKEIYQKLVGEKAKEIIDINEEALRLEDRDE